MWEAWTKAGLNEQQLVQFVHRLKVGRPRARATPPRAALRVFNWIVLIRPQPPPALRPYRLVSE